MNKKLRLMFGIAFVVLLFALFTSGCASSSNDGDKFIMGGTYRLSKGETINGNLSIFGGAVSLDEGSTVNGDVTVIGGSVIAAGTINGGINGLGGSITLDDTAVVQGDVSTVAASVNKSDSAVIQGKFITQSESGVEIPDVPKVAVPAIVKPFSDAMGSLLRSLVIALLAVLVMLFAPRQTNNVTKAIEDSPVAGGAIGLLTWILFPFVIIILAITLILIPLSLIAIVIFGLGVILGWIAVGQLLGDRIASLFKSTWAPAVSAGVGTFFLSILSSLLGAIPCVGWVIPVIIALVATGGVVMSAFGTRNIQKPGGRPTIQVEVPPASPIPPANPFQSQYVASASPQKSVDVVDSTFVSETNTANEVPPAEDSVKPEKKVKSRSQKSGEENQSEKKID